MSRAASSRLVAAAVSSTLGAVAVAAFAAPPAEIAAANDLMLAEHARVHGLDVTQQAKIAEIFAKSDRIGQGLPGITVHAMTPAQCTEKLAAAGVDWRDAESERICGGPYLRPLYDPATQTPADAKACIDVMEFPNLPCTYPVTWVKAVEAADICAAEGKRLCDAHEWEGACAGALRPPDYRFELAGGAAGTAVSAMRKAHNDAEGPTKAWTYGPTWENGRCAAASFKSEGCDGSDWKKCGTNTYPTGAFPSCTNALGVTDLHGNAAEHMNLPLKADQMSSAGSTQLGVTEMKGSWFIWDTFHAHEDWCRWRAPYWHGGPVRAEDSHRNYHLGFRCCKSVGG